MAKKAAHGEEVWQNVMAGRFNYFLTDKNGKRQYKHVLGGGTFRLTEDDRELISDDIINPKNDPFTNGRLKRVDSNIRTEETPEEEAEGKTELPEGYNPELAQSREDLAALFAKSGMAFQSAVKKLDERNARALKALSEDEGREVTVAQSKFLNDYIAENFRRGGPTSSGQEILDEKSTKHS